MKYRATTACLSPPGMSGHGFGIGPGIGRVMADVIQGRDSGYDLNRFRFNRFTDGSPIVPGPY